jgi:hypothetical protein
MNGESDGLLGLSRFFHREHGERSATGTGRLTGSIEDSRTVKQIVGAMKGFEKRITKGGTLQQDHKPIEEIETGSGRWNTAYREWIFEKRGAHEIEYYLTVAVNPGELRECARSATRLECFQVDRVWSVRLTNGILGADGHYEVDPDCTPRDERKAQEEARMLIGKYPTILDRRAKRLGRAEGTKVRA